MADTFDAFELLQEELKDDDNENIITSVNRIGIVALAMGPKRTVEQLLPFLLGIYVKELKLYVAFDENNEEALSTIATQLGNFVEYVGGVENAPKLLPVLEKLACSDETAIREAAVESINKIHGLFSVDQLVAHSVPMLKRLVQGEWFTNRVSACGILNEIYKRVPATTKDDLRLLYNMVAHDETPMVRKAAYIATPSLVQSYKKEHVSSDIIPAVKILATDAADSTRVCIVECVGALSSVYTGEEFETVVAPLVDCVVNDASWRVRQKLGKLFDKVMGSSSDAIKGNILLPHYAKLLKDNESEVRQGAVSSLLAVAKVSPVAPFTQIVGPVLQLTMVDPINTVRVSFAEALVDLCPILGKDFTSSTLLPIILKFVKDDDADVRLNVIGKIDILIPVIGHDQVATIFSPIIIDLSKDPKWRVRLSIVEKLTFLAQQMGAQVFDKSLKEIITSTLADSVHAVRSASAEQVCQIVKVLGYDWSIKKLLPQIFSLYEQSGSYLQRIVPIMVISHIVNVFSQDALMEHCVPILLKGCKDPVSNVRFGVAKALEQVIPSLNPSVVQSRIKPLLLELKNDSDVDVQYFATLTLKKC